MASANWNQAIKRVLADEGGNDNDPRDPGGRTSRGIIQSEWDHYRITHPGLPSDVWQAPQSAVLDIYHTNYAIPMRFDDLPAGVDYAVLDYAINSGVGRAGKVLRKLVGWPTNTSTITSEVVAAVAKRDPKALITAIYDERLAFLKSLRIFQTFGKGWTRRCVGGETAAIAMSKQRGPSSLPPEVIPSGGKGKGQIPAPNTVAVTHGAPIATVAAGAGLWGWVTAHPALSTLVIAGLLAGILVTLNAIKAARVKTQETPPADLKPVPELRG